MNSISTWLADLEAWHGPAAAAARIVLILAGVWIAQRLATRLICMFRERITARMTGAEEVRRAETLGRVFRYLATVAVGLMGGVLVLAECGVSVAPILGAAGVVGLAIGFGAQSLVKDYFTGVFLLVENQIIKGDVVEIAGKSGLVEDLTLRYVQLRDYDGNVHFVPNGLISTVTNMSRGYAYAVVDVGIAYREEVDVALGVMRTVAAGLAADAVFADRILAEFEVAGVERWDESAVVLRGRFKVRPLEQWNVRREVPATPQGRLRRRRHRNSISAHDVVCGRRQGRSRPGVPRRGDRDVMRSAFIRYVLPILAALSLIAFVGVPYIEHILTDWFRSDIELRARLVMNSMEEPLTDLLERNERARLAGYLERVVSDERLLAVLICDASGAKVYATNLVPADVTCDSPTTSLVSGSTVTRIPSGLIEVSSFTINSGAGQPYRALLVHDLSFIDRRQATARNFVLAFAVLAVGVLGILGGLVTRYMLNRSIKVLLGDIRSRRFLDDARSPRLLAAGAVERAHAAAGDRAEPAARDRVPRELDAAGAAAGRARASRFLPDDGGLEPRAVHPQSRRRTASRSSRCRRAAWSPPSSRSCAPAPASGSRTAAAARTGESWTGTTASGCRRTIRRTRCAASGSRRRRRRATTTASRTRACGRCATWPTCDRRSARSDWTRLPGRQPEVRRRRRGRSDGTTRPSFSIQDFHFALLPRLIRERKPRRRRSRCSGTSPGRTPKRSASARGSGSCSLHMLSADILGFHTRYHCQNFLATVDRYRRMPDRSRTHDRDAPGPRLPSRALSDLDRVAAALAGEAVGRAGRAG